MDSVRNEAAKEMSRQRLLGWGAALLGSAGAVGLAGCGGGSSSASERPAVGRPAAITLWTQWTQTDNLPGLEAALKEFQQKQSNVTVSVESVPRMGPTDYFARLLVAVQAGTAPDSYVLNRWQTPQLAALGVLNDLGKYVSREKGLSDQHFPFAWAETQFRGKTWSLPFSTDLRALFCNKDVLAQVGLNPDELDMTKSPPITVDRLAEINSKLNQDAADGGYSRVGVVPWAEQGNPFTWGVVYGAQFVDAKRCEVTPTERPMLAAYQFLYDWAMRFGAQRIQSFLATAGAGGPAQNPLITGKKPITVAVGSILTTIDQYAPSMGLVIAYLPVPKKGDKPTTWSGGFSMVIPTGAKEPDAAWQTNAFISGPDGQRAFCKARSTIPTWKALLKEKGMVSPQQQPMVDKLLPVTLPPPHPPVAAQLFDELTAALNQVTRAESLPQPALEAVGNRVNPLLKPFCPL